MVKFCNKDYNLPRIRTNSKLFNLLTKYSYYIFGLDNKRGEDIFISYKEELLNDEEVDNNIICLFLNKNHLKTKEEFEFYDNKFDIKIGLRYNLRKDVVFCSCLLQTIIYYLEGRLELDLNYKIPGIPKL